LSVAAFNDVAVLLKQVIRRPQEYLPIAPFDGIQQSGLIRKGLRGGGSANTKSHLARVSINAVYETLHIYAVRKLRTGENDPNFIMPVQSVDVLFPAEAKTATLDKALRYTCGVEVIVRAINFIKVPHSLRSSSASIGSISDPCFGSS
jgi:hypothetical protein